MAKVVAAGWGTELINKFYTAPEIKPRMIWRKRWIEERTFGGSDASGKWMNIQFTPLPNHHFPNGCSSKNVSSKFKHILAAKWLVQHSKVRPPTSSDDLRLLFGPTLFRMVTHSVAYLYSHLYKDNSLCLTWKLNKGGLLQMESLVSCPFQSNHLQTLDITVKKKTCLWN